MWIALLGAAACGSDSSSVTLGDCWAINDAAIECCAGDLACRHGAYENEIATCFDAAACEALAAWLRCAGSARCAPGDCAADCGAKPGECPRPS